MPKFFDSYQLRDITLRNRIVVSPMSNHSALDSVLTEWHLVDHASIVCGGAGLVVAEGTSASLERRTALGDSGILNDEQVAELASVALSIKAAGANAGIQFAHAGRKASANRPWEGNDPMSANDSGGWDTIAQSAIALEERPPKVPNAHGGRLECRGRFPTRIGSKVMPVLSRAFAQRPLAGVPTLGPIGKAYFQTVNI